MCPKGGLDARFLRVHPTAALMVLAVNAIITFMDVSPSAKLILATLAGLWIGIAAAAGSAGIIAISKPFPVVGLLFFCLLSVIRIGTMQLSLWHLLYQLGRWRCVASLAAGPTLRHFLFIRRTCF